MRRITIGTRGSALAQCQTQDIVNKLHLVAPDLAIAIEIIKTTGDRDKTTPLAQLGGRGVFTKEIEAALLQREIDLAVHSLKDLPTELTPGLSIAAISEREDARDCLVSAHGHGLMQLPSGARVGTSSARRSAQLLARRPDLQIIPLRGNVDTRLRKAHSDEYDAIVLAAAGIIRLGRAKEITEYLSFDEFLPDPGQGALAVQIRADDAEVREIISRIDHADTRAAASAERAFLAGLGGGCQMPIAAYAEVRGGDLQLRGIIATTEGRRVIRGARNGPANEAEQIGLALARQLLNHGASDLSNATISATPNRPRALAGKRILITRAHNQAHTFANQLRARGAVPVEFPTIEISPLEQFEQLDAALHAIANFDWIVFTSVNGVRSLLNRMTELELQPMILTQKKIGAIGSATARALMESGLSVDFIPTKFLGEHIALELPIAAGQSALLLRADIASDGLARGLSARGVRVTNVDAYRTGLPPEDHAVGFDLTQLDAITFTSSSTVRNFLILLKGDAQQLQEIIIACIGPVTAETARELGLRVDVVASEYTIEGLIAALEIYFER